MKLLSLPSEDAVIQAIREERAADYIYMYPPRQTYRALETTNVAGLLEASFARFSDVELYLHFPFCRQICSFCNLFAAVATNESETATYTHLLLEEMAESWVYLAGKQINSVYFGGGTPSALPLVDLERVFDALESRIPFGLKGIREVSMEVAPDTVDRMKFARLQELGLNRVNLGVQSLNNNEIVGIGRRYERDRIDNAVRTLKDVGIRNISIDLIYSLPGQTFEHWTHSVKEAIKLKPDTLCLYPYTSRENTGYSRAGATTHDPQRYQKFDEAVQMLLRSGFNRETHVRYVRKDSHGGYVQKVNHWALKNVFGFGAGARSYLWDCDKRNGYSVKRRRESLRKYMEAISEKRFPMTDGFLMNDEERRRKAVVLNLIDLDLQWYAGLFGSAAFKDFGREFEFLIQEDLLQVSDTRARLTERGVRHRDTIVQLFFSERVRRLVAAHSYDE